MNDQAFLDAILAAPDDDAPRLVYADWLDEHDQAERAEFIRVQCDLARRPKYDPGRPESENRARALLHRHGAEWAKPVAAITKDYEFRRGFVAGVSIGARKFLTHGDQLFRLAPVRHVRFIRLGSSNVKAADLIAFPHLSRIRSLVLTGSLADKELRALLTAPALKPLTGLSLEGHFPTDALDPILEGRLPYLERLDLNAQGVTVLTGSHAEALADSKWVKNLKYLDLSWHGLNVGGVQALAGSKRLKGLTRLGLRFTGAGLGGTQALAESSTLTRLSVLDLRNNRLTDKAVQALASSRKLPALTDLYLGSNAFGPEAVRALAAWPGLARLRALHLYGNKIGDEGALALAESPHAANLWYLDLTETGLTERGHRALAASPYLKTANLAGLPFWPKDDEW
jgi:uncharacterized protein (TIGR02996 family)